MKKLLLTFSILISGVSFANYPYNAFKEVEFDNPYITKEFENFITNIQKNDMEFIEKINPVEESFNKRLAREKKLIAYRTDKERNERLNRFFQNEKKNYDSVKDLFLSNEIKIFNDFINRMKNHPQLSQEERNNFFTALKPLHKAYKDTLTSTNYIIDSKEACFKNENPSYEPPYFCEPMYTDLKAQNKSNKFQLGIYTNKFINAYKVSQNKYDADQYLIDRIEELKRNRGFKWE